MATVTHQATTEHDDHHDDDHHDDDHHGEELLTSLSTWNIWICGIVICCCLCGCLFLNTFIIISMRKKHSSSSNYKILYMGSFTFLFVYTILLPATLAGVADTKNVISERYCYLQETFNFGAILVSFFFASLACLNRMVVVVTNKKNWCQGWRAFLTMLVLVVIFVCVTTIPYIALSDEDHGCHLWSGRIDDAMWIRIFVIISLLFICIGSVIGSFAKIYHHVLLSMVKVNAHNVSAVANGTVTKTSLIVSQEADSVSKTESGPIEGAKKRGDEAMLSVTERDTSFNSEPSTSNGSSTAGSSTSGTSTRVRREEKLAAHKRVARIAFFLVSFYVVFWLPWVLASWLITHYFTEYTEVRITTMVLGYLPSVLDPIMYILMVPNLKESLLQTIKCAQ